MPNPPNLNAQLRPLNPHQKSLARALRLWLCGVTLLSGSSRAFSQNPGPSIQAKIVPLFKEARLAEQRRDFPEAAKLYDKILELDPNLAEVWTNKGLALYELSKHSDALAAFAKAAVLKPQLLVPHLFVGIEYLKLGQPEKAVGPLRSVLALEPHHPQATYELANAYIRMEQFELATGLYRDLVRREPEMEQARYRLGIAYLNWSKAAARELIDSSVPSPYGKILLAELQAAGGVYEDAEKNYRAAVAARPDLVEAHLALGRFCLDFQTVPEPIQRAHEQFAMAKDLDPRDPQLEIDLVRLALVQANFPEAVGHLKKVMQADLPYARKCLPELAVGLSQDTLKKIIAEASALQPTPTDYHRTATAARMALLYAAYLELGDAAQTERSRRDFEEVAKRLETAPARPELKSYSGRLKQLDEAEHSRRVSLEERVDLAVCAWNVGEYDRALETLLGVLKRSRNDQALHWLSRICRSLARQTFLEAIRRNPNSYRAHLLLADLANDSHNTSRAAEEYQKAVSLGAADPEVHLLYIQFLTSKGRDREALVEALAAVEKFPPHPALNCELGKLLLKMRSPQDAAPYFERALEADPTFQLARAGLADSFAARGETAKAIQEMKQALGADTDGSFHYRLGRWYQKTGQAKEASEAFSISTRLKEQRWKRDSERLMTLKPGD